MYFRQVLKVFKVLLDVIGSSSSSSLLFLFVIILSFIVRDSELDEKHSLRLSLTVVLRSLMHNKSPSSSSSSSLHLPICNLRSQCRQVGRQGKCNSLPICNLRSQCWQVGRQGQCNSFESFPLWALKGIASLSKNEAGNVKH